MHVHAAPSSRLAQISPLVVPKYTPTDSCESVALACRLTVKNASALGNPLSWRCQLLPALRVTYTAGLPPGLVRGHTSVPSIGKTHTVSGSCGCNTIGKPMSPTCLGIWLPIRIQ